MRFGVFGWFKKTASQKERQWFLSQANRARSHIQGQIDRTYFCVAKGRIDFSDPEERQKLLVAFRIVWQQLSRNRENWVRNIQQFSQQGEVAAATKYDQAAVLLLTGLVMTDMTCRRALEFQNDNCIIGLAKKLLIDNFSSFDLVMCDIYSITFGELTPSAELLPELQYANTFFDKNIF